ncbi:dipeptide transport system permease protein [Melghirimyces profundicolus]|uniref:Dipeptide transport system permease protein n=1 Tax=Melghirimyces profundicolus TaxID=1242148 RepID=A0A2T6BTC2_9BACL|nr:ABC transporter permease [Melghirimyces profundicolus]PTX59331.1 dipeptide transport system permease protein [Melghirimyces profundicolus]
MAIPAEKFRRVERRQTEAESIRRPSVSFWQDAWRRLKKNWAAMMGLYMIIFLVVMAIIGPWMTEHNYYETNLAEGKNLEPSGEHWFGTDELGRDVFVRTWWGARISLTIGITAALIDLVIGVIYGGISGYKGGRTDEIMMRIVDVLWGLPYLVLVILLLVVMEPGVFTIIVALSITGWLNMARVVRGQVLQLKSQEFVMAARTLGADTKRLMMKHLIPNTMGPILVILTLTIPTAILSEAFLSFLGLGVQAPVASWGTMITDSTVVILTDEWWRLFFPAFFLSMTLLSFNLFGDGLRDALDPKMRK